MFRKSPNERVDITKPGQTLTSGGGRQEIVVRGVFVDEGGVIKGRIENTAVQVSRSAISRYDQGMPARVDDIVQRNR